MIRCCAAAARAGLLLPAEDCAWAIAISAAAAWPFAEMVSFAALALAAPWVMACSFASAMASKSSIACFSSLTRSFTESYESDFGLVGSAHIPCSSDTYPFHTTFKPSLPSLRAA
ncbi:hypothetical protein HMPREF9336_01546 [Segniliparus rugosus ATCC BAA-974]|uniref:Uncharacterized protein n=1 Tax=Segniliparus rugosus (strain ATCC BAA-974 / DSM 45345 / CCUG 50838 / CIP 108380 / JCM 13579 / CDC 945) TaxID=679197 RepID=E5XPX4_SEGRC|nr:hypothetical protein HMPREF9336_01546 [Segniliparus rugosus ATCC BAA-974]